MLGYAFTWRRLVAATARDRPQRTARLDAVPPYDLQPSPRRRLPGDPDLRAVAERLLPLRLAIDDDAPARVNLLLDGVDPRRPPEGMAAHLHLARRLAARGLRVRIVTVDPVVALPRTWSRDLEARAGVPGLFDAVEVEFGAAAPAVEVSRTDAFVATGWRTAHAARAAAGGERFVYVIGDDEALSLPAGTFAALAAESYTFRHFALFSSGLLRDWFRGRGAGVYAGGAAAGDRASAVFEEAVTVAPPAADLRAGRRLLFAAGSPLFELGVLALGRSSERGGFAGWTLQAVGAGRRGRRLDLGGGDWMELLDGNVDLAGYDVGLAPAPGPRPGPVALAMARAGLVVVTTTFANKDASALAAISPNLIAAVPTVEGIAGALLRAAEAAADVQARVRGSALRWSLDWDASFSDELLDRLTGVLRAA
jgi:hypothetical protein